MTTKKIKSERKLKIAWQEQEPKPEDIKLIPLTLKEIITKSEKLSNYSPSAKPKRHLGSREEYQHIAYEPLTRANPLSRNEEERHYRNYGIELE